MHGCYISLLAPGSGSPCVDTQEWPAPNEHTAATGKSHHPLRSLLKEKCTKHKNENIL